MQITKETTEKKWVGIRRTLLTHICAHTKRSSSRIKEIARGSLSKGKSAGDGDVVQFGHAHVRPSQSKTIFAFAILT